MVFLCVPRWHDDAAFAGLLGAEGRYSVTPADTRFVSGGRYLPGTLVWRARWVTTEGIVESREALALPADPHRAVLLRRVEAVDADARVEVILDCRADWGSHHMRMQRQPDGTWLGASGDVRLRWTGAAEARPADGALRLVLDLRAGECHDLVLELADGVLREAAPDPDLAWRQTEDQWAEGQPAVDQSVAPEETRHSYAVLRGLTSMTGAMVAAATTSVPERPERDRNYDYRFAWVRDQCIVGQALAVLGGDPLFDAAVHVVTERLLADGDRLRPAYAVDGSRVPEPRSVDLPGYPGGAAVHVGNQVRDQFQLDAYGEAMLLLSAADRLGRLDADGQRAAELAADVIAHHWRDPDAGIWELEERRWAHSRLMCAAGLRASAGRPGERRHELTALADRLVDDVASDCLHPSGRWQRAPDDPGLDSALLVPAIRGAVPADDPRSVATWRAVLDELTEDGFVYRFHQDDGPLSDGEGAFLLSGFQTVLASHQQGQQTVALRLFERSRGAPGTAALFTEEYDVPQRQLRGNLPQAFVHGMLIECCSRLADEPGSTAN